MKNVTLISTLALLITACSGKKVEQERTASTSPGITQVTSQQMQTSASCAALLEASGFSQVDGLTWTRKQNLSCDLSLPHAEADVTVTLKGDAECSEADFDVEQVVATKALYALIPSIPGLESIEIPEDESPFEVSINCPPASVP